MGTRTHPTLQRSGPVADQIRELMRTQIGNGWTGERIALEMQKLGHGNWSCETVSQVCTGRRLMLTVDEAVALLAIFKYRAKMIENETTRMVAALTNGAGK